VSSANLDLVRSLTHVLVLVRARGVAKTSGIDLKQIGGERTALPVSLRDRKVTRLVLYFDRALADLGLGDRRCRRRVHSDVSAVTHDG
jgi:hypothetical protein